MILQAIARQVGWRRRTTCERWRENAVEVEILWHEDWKSWQMGSSPGERKLLGTTTLAHVRGQVLAELRRLLQENGESGYKQKWVQHDFPDAEMRALEEAG